MKILKLPKYIYQCPKCGFRGWVGLNEKYYFIDNNGSSYINCSKCGYNIPVSCLVRSKQTV